MHALALTSGVLTVVIVACVSRAYLLRGSVTRPAYLVIDLPVDDDDDGIDMSYDAEANMAYAFSDKAVGESYN